MSLEGTTLAGKYLVKRLIGRGGMGAVYEGTHVEIGKRVAIKVIDAQFAGSEEIAIRFRREARAASAVESDAIVQVFDVGSDPQVGLYMVMEFLTGEDLSARLQREGKLDPPLALTLGLQAARALGKAHAAGVVHRDLKPANLFLCATEDEAPRLKVVDFGISKLMRSGEQTTGGAGTKPLTRTGTVIGTPEYMSPEQAQGLEVDARTDVWSLGAVLYEALAGVPAFPPMATYEQTIIKIVTTKPKPITEVAPWISPEVAAVVHGALEHDAASRFADGAAMARAIASATGRASVPFVVPSSSPDARTTDPSAPTVEAPAATASGVAVTARSTRSRTPMVVAAAVVVVAVVIGAVAVGKVLGGTDHASASTATATASIATSTSTASATTTAVATTTASEVLVPTPTVTPSVTRAVADAGAVKIATPSSHASAKPVSSQTGTSQFGGIPGGVTGAYQ